MNNTFIYNLINGCKKKVVTGILFFSVVNLLSTHIVKAQVMADQIVGHAIEKAGGDRYEKAVIQFTFRGNHYQSSRKNDIFQLERTIIKPEGLLQDIINNQGFERYLDHCPLIVEDSLITRISDGINSVHYFALLPYGLNAPAVRKKLAGETVIKNQPYYKIEVTFSKEGGGTDFEDVFMYWIHKEEFTVDYLAYQYAVNGGGIRFREAFNPRVINGIRFVDYKNYKTDDLKTPLKNLDRLFEKQKLKLLSEIKTENIRVNFVESDCC